MRLIINITRGLSLLYVLLASYHCEAQSDSAKPEISVTLHHLVINNNFQYLLVETKSKVKGKWQPLKKQVLQLYLDDNKPENLITKVQTDSEGKAKSIIPPNLKPLWDLNSIHKFIAVTEGTFKEEETTTELEITKAKILIDTATIDSIRTVSVHVLKLENNIWQPAKGVDVKIGVKRLGGDLKIGDEESYSTDSLGSVSADFKLDSLPGDKKGDLTFLAKIEDDDKYGSLSVEKNVPWGIEGVSSNGFGERALWASRGRSPIWLMLMAYSIIAAVWGVIFYLIFRIIKISKLGKRNPSLEQLPTS